MDFQDSNGERSYPQTERKLRFRPSSYCLVVYKGKLLAYIPHWKEDGFDLPGGGQELGEEIHKGAIREAEEESGYKLRIKTPHKPLYLKTNLLYEPITEAYFQGILSYFEAELESTKQDKSKITWNEVKEVVWLDLKKIDPDKFMFVHRDALKTFLNQVDS